MRETLLGMLVMVLSRATLEELWAIYRFATGEGLSGAILDAGCSMLDDRAKRGAAERGVEGKPKYVFRWNDENEPRPAGSVRADAQFPFRGVCGKLRLGLINGLLWCCNFL